ncbi:MAG TPA: hypothetical protein DCY02_08025 [Armatimonadetes bacterium]|nr:hypothetical protein [Armatimonadota bacterium]HCM72885.1 hypothetical protein [Armatimonadota bacterium]
MIPKRVAVEATHTRSVFFHGRHGLTTATSGSRATGTRGRVTRTTAGTTLTNGQTLNLVRRTVQVHNPKRRIVQSHTDEA